MLKIVLSCLVVIRELTGFKYCLSQLPSACGISQFLHVNA